MTEVKKKASERVKVFMRVRPLSEEEQRSSSHETVVEKSDKTHVTLSTKKETEKKSYTFDSVFDHLVCQKDIYNTVGKPVVDSVLQGYNGTILAYGQTGTGKTHTMIGGQGKTKGVIPRCMKEIFAAIKASETHSFTVKVAFLQLYMEVLQDLIKPDPNNPIRLREDSDEGVYLAGLHWTQVTQISDCMSLMAQGDKNRNYAATSMNAHSSRSHAVYMVKIEKRNKLPKEDDDTNKKSKDNSMTRSTLYLVDLAGSERVSKTKVSGARLDEAKNINLALLALGNCIQALAEGKSKYIPFRDSKLTRLLEDSLGGNSKTSLIVTIGPAASNYQESVSSLNFGSRAMKIQNRPELNLKVDYKALCDKLQAELDKINDRENINNIDLDKLMEENQALKQTIETLTTEKMQLEITLEELKKGTTDCSIVDGSNIEFARIKKYYKTKLEKQEADHTKFMMEIDKTLLDQEEQINSLKNLNFELENTNKQMSIDMKKLVNELESERNDRDLRIGQMINEIEDLRLKINVEKSNFETARQEVENLKTVDMKKSNSTNNITPIKMKVVGVDFIEKVKQCEAMIANQEIELAQFEEKYNEEAECHKQTKLNFETQINEWKEKEKKMDSEIGKLKKQQTKLIKAFKNLEKKSGDEIKGLQDELEKVSEQSKQERSNAR